MSLGVVGLAEGFGAWTRAHAYLLDQFCKQGTAFPRKAANTTSDKSNVNRFWGVQFTVVTMNKQS